MTDQQYNYLYNLELMCNVEKGFAGLLFDNLKSFSKYDDICNNLNKKSDINKLIEEFGFDKIPQSNQRYFFNHLNSYFILTNKYSFNDKILNILSSIICYVDNPFDYIVYILNKKLNSSTLQEYVDIFNSNSFNYSISNQFKTYKVNSRYFPNEIYIDKKLFSNSNLDIYNKLNNIFRSYKVNNLKDFKIVLEKITSIYSNANTSSTPLPTISTSENSTGKVVTNKVSKLPDTEKSSDNKKNIVDNINDKLLNSFLNPDGEYINKTYERYKKLVDRLEYDSPDCRIAKTVLYILSYISKDSELKTSEYVNNIINSNSSWAVGNENSYDASFYGDSDIAKYFSTYYSFMNNDDNPYSELINNKTYSEMNLNAMSLHNYFKEHGIVELDLTNDTVNKIYKLLVNVRDIIRVLDEPINISSGTSNYIKGIISGIMNSAATMLDFALSSAVKQLFYLDILPIGKNKFSIADIYNYLAFLKLVFESIDDDMKIEMIDRDTFINQAYKSLGIDNNSIEKIGYGAYSASLNREDFLEQYYSFLFPNDNGTNFILSNDLKLLYSLIQFAIQKRAYLSGDINFPNKVNFGDKHQINTLLSSLTALEIFYIFKLYNISIFNLDDNIKDGDPKDLFNFNRKLLFIDNIYPHDSQDFYKLYLDEDKKSLSDSYYNTKFNKTKYRTLINNMFNIYIKAISYNKRQFEELFLQVNNATNVDDFLLRFLPSIVEMMKTLGQNNTSIKNVVQFIDYLMTLISSLLYEKLFIEIKKKIHELLKRYTEDMFKYIDKKADELSEKFSFMNSELNIDLNLGELSAVQAMDKIIKMLELGQFNLFNIDNCFIDNNIEHSGYEPMEEDKLIFTDGPSVVNKSDLTLSPTLNPSENNLDSSTISTENNKENSSKTNNKDKVFDVILEKNNSLSENKKISYSNGNIFIEKENGEKNIIVSKNDVSTDDKVVIEYPDIVSKNLSPDEFKQLIEIRDYIDNITNQELINLNKQLKENKDKLTNELNKNNPNYSIIKNINKTIQKLTAMINDVKTKNRILQSDIVENEPIIIKDFDDSNPETNYSTLDSFFKKQKTILKEVNYIVMDNYVPLTNYQITNLLK